MTSMSYLPFWERRFRFLSTPRLFNAALTIQDAKGLARPYLAEALPEINTDTWRVLPDGRMETTYRIRPNLVWQDGGPHSAQDFVFSWQTLTAPDMGAGNLPPQNVMEEVLAPDPRTVLIRWRQPYPYAGLLDQLFQPLPRHLLQQAFAERQGDSFVALPYWTREYVGLGPYRVENWEPGSFVEGIAFPGHALGKPKIDRIRVMFMSDPNSVLANILAGSVHAGIELSLRLQQAEVLQREWGPQNAGTVLMSPALWRAVVMQQRPDYASPGALLDVRVRKAIAHSMDRQGLNEAVLNGHGVISEFLISPLSDYFEEVERATVKHPYDPRRAERLLAEAGYVKGADGFFASRGERFSTELRALTGTQQELEIAILGAGWRQFGLDIRESTIPAVQAQDKELQATLPGLFAGGAGSGEGALGSYTTASIARPENRWTGRNFVGWSNGEYDRLFEAFSRTLDRTERIQQIAQMARKFTQESPGITMDFSVEAMAHVAALHGPHLVAPDTPTTWNIHEWVLE
jgi:peptide/nickel transport system substrate-binding protein